MITTLAGGGGAAKFLRGLVRVASPGDITVIVNTGDDSEFYDLYVCPDLDIITYTLAGVVDEQKGWGFRDETFHFLETIRNYGEEAWFSLGDRDLATHVHRTRLLQQGLSLTEVADRIRRAWGVQSRIIPMSDAPVRTRFQTPAGELAFQEYFVKRQAGDAVEGVIFQGSEQAAPALGVRQAILEAERIIICPSNPIISIGTILS
ncbi:MAG: YvcK family protein, partial [Chloroflexi bacterium]|nr:YvcK family protein [Chloroflexota bacterium]